MPTSRNLRDIGLVRVKEAQCLHREGFHDGCIYVCGYVVEMALKARICRVLRLKEYPSSGELARVFKVHDFDILKTLGALADLLTTSGPELLTNWSKATSCKPESRYGPPGSSSADDAAEVLRSLTGRPYGLLTWLQRYW